MHGLIQHLPDVCMVRYMHVHDSLDIYVSRNDFSLEGRKHRMILNKSPLINVLFWLQTVLDRCVTNVGNPHKKDYYVSQHTFVLWKLDLYDVATVLYWPAVQFKLYWVILSFSRLSTTLSICNVQYDLSGRRIRMGATYNLCLPSM